MDKNFKPLGALSPPQHLTVGKPPSLAISVYWITANLPACTHKTNIAGYSLFITA